ncbi:hypothetical protein E5288_WYG017553 [Bos mutus]|uniref:Homeobox domain-containing protein n=1 Tax=Bos mutus TaxID=72004 RepID=A0A6B0S0P5_9CETA|nr:hypothetical protein [Bos mutus]
MQEPESVMSPTWRSAPPKRKRRQRTVYSKEQLEALKEAFLKNEYPSYQDRLRLAAKLHLEEHRVQELFSKPSSPLKSVSPVDKDDLGSQRFTNLQGRGHPSPQSPADPEGPERTRAL